RSSAIFFKESSQKLFGILPVFTYNQSLAEKKSVSIQKYLKLIFENINSIDESAFYIQKNLEQNAIKIKLKLEHPDCKKDLIAVLKQALEKHLSNQIFYFIDLSENQFNDNIALLLGMLLKNYSHCRILKLSHNCITEKGLGYLLEASIDKPSLKY